MTQAAAKRADRRRQDTLEMIAAINANAERAARARAQAAIYQMLAEERKEKAKQRIYDAVSVAIIAVAIVTFTVFMWIRTDQLAAAIMG